MRAAKKALGELKAQETNDEESLADVEKQTEKQLNKRSMLVQKREENLRKIQQLGSLPAQELETYADESVRELMKKLVSSMNEKRKLERKQFLYLPRFAIPDYSDCATSWTVSAIDRCALLDFNHAWYGNQPSLLLTLYLLSLGIDLFTKQLQIV